MSHKTTAYYLDDPFEEHLFKKQFVLRGFYFQLFFCWVKLHRMFEDERALDVDVEEV